MAKVPPSHRSVTLAKRTHHGRDEHAVRGFTSSDNSYLRDIHFSKRMKAPDRIDVARQVTGQVLTHPVTWAPFLPVAAAYAFLSAPWWLCFALAVAVAFVVFLAWSHYWPRLTAVTRAKMLVAHRASDDKELTERIQRLAVTVQQRPAKEVLDALREAMGTKRAVEDRLHADGTVTEHEEEVGAMVGDLVRTMVAEAERLTSADGGEMSRSAMERFQKAAATLRQVYSEIDVILDPVPEEMRLPRRGTML